MKYLVLILSVLLLLFCVKREGFTTSKEYVSYPNVYKTEADRINREYLGGRKALLNYYNSRMFNYENRDFTLRPQQANANLYHKKTLKTDNISIEERTYGILDKMDSILTKMVKDHEQNSGFIKDYNAKGTSTANSKEKNLKDNFTVTADGCFITKIIDEKCKSFSDMINVGDNEYVNSSENNEQTGYLFDSEKSGIAYKYCKLSGNDKCLQKITGKPKYARVYVENNGTKTLLNSDENITSL